MKLALLVLVLGVLSASAQNQEQKQTPPSSEGSKAKPCLIVKHKGTIGRRLIWTALIAVPIAPGANYDYVDSVNYTAKPKYKGKELQQVQAQGVHVIILERNYKQENLDAARKACREPEAQPVQPKQEQPKQEAKPPETE